MLNNSILKYAQNKKPSKYPVVIIGAGLGGLCCAAYLSKLGFPVTMVEQGKTTGGYATCFKRKKYYFDVSLGSAVINNCSVASILDELDIFKYLNLIEPPELYRYKSPDFDITIPQRNIDAYMEILIGLFPSEKKGIQRFFSEVCKISEVVEKSYANSHKQLFMSENILYTTRSLFFKFRKISSLDFLNGFVKNSDLINILSSHWFIHGLPPSRLSLFPFIVSLGNFLNFGTYVIEGGSKNLSDRLTHEIEKSGGKILTETLAEKIVLNNGSVCGLNLSNGKELKAKFVVSNASAKNTYYNLLPGHSLPDMSILNNFEISLSAFCVWVGLNQNLKGIVDGYIIRMPTGKGPDHDYQSFLIGDIENCPLGVNVFCNIPELKNSKFYYTMQIIFGCSYDVWKKFEKDYFSGRKTEYRKEKKRWTKKILERVEKDLIPGLHSYIDYTVAATPLTFKRYTLNDNGAIFGFNHLVKNELYFKNITPINGLYLVGAWSHPGQGFGSCLRSGEIISRRILRKI